METPRLILMLSAAILAANVPVRAQHMNEKDSPCANIMVTVELTNCLAKARDAADGQLNITPKHISVAAASAASASGSLQTAPLKIRITLVRWRPARDGRYSRGHSVA